MFGLAEQVEGFVVFGEAHLTLGGEVAAGETVVDEDGSVGGGQAAALDFIYVDL